MPPVAATQFFGLPAAAIEGREAQVDAVILPLPVEKTVSYGTGTGGGPQAILDASLQIETFDEETLVNFAEAPRLLTLPPLSTDGDLEACLGRIENRVRLLRKKASVKGDSPIFADTKIGTVPEKFLLSLGGEHSITYGVVTGLVDNPADVTVVQIDAHADLADQLHGRRWSHGTVMRRLWERGCTLVQIGIRSLSRSEYELATAGPRITTFYAHRLENQWADILTTLRDLEGKVYLTIDVDGLDPSIIPSTGTPQPGGLMWRQMMDVLRVLMTESPCQVIGADIVEFIPSPVPPGCDPAAARLTMKLLAWWWKGR